MMYPYMTLDDDTEIVHSELKEDGTVKVYIETPDTKGGFYNASCILPDGKWIDVVGYSESRMDYFKQLIKNNTQMIMKSAKESLANERWLMESKAQLEKGKVIAVETLPDAEEISAFNAYKTGAEEYQPSCSHEELLKELGL